MQLTMHIYFHSLSLFHIQDNMNSSGLLRLMWGTTFSVIQYLWKFCPTKFPHFSYISSTRSLLNVMQLGVSFLFQHLFRLFYVFSLHNISIRVTWPKMIKIFIYISGNTIIEILILMNSGPEFHGVRNLLTNFLPVYFWNICVQETVFYSATFHPYLCFLILTELKQKQETEPFAFPVDLCDKANSYNQIENCWQIFPIKNHGDDFRECWSPKLLLNDLNVLNFSPRINFVILLYKVGKVPQFHWHFEKRHIWLNEKGYVLDYRISEICTLSHTFTIIIII